MTTPTPSSGELRLYRRIRQYLNSGQLEPAQVALESLLRRNPQDVEARLQLADVMLQRGYLRASTDEVLRLAATPPEDAGLLVSLAHALNQRGQVVQARACLDRLQSRTDLEPGLLVDMAYLRATLKDYAQALKLIEKALSAGIEAPDEYYLHATLLQNLGNIDAADRVLQDCLERWPMFSGAAMAQARLRTQTDDCHHVPSLRKKLERIPRDSMVPGDRLVRAEFESALFNELDDLGRHDEAWRALETSSAIMRELIPYDALSESAMADAILERDLPAVAHDFLSDGDPIPVFIIGMPRSGTTLLDRMLSSHSRVASAGEINDFMQQLSLCCDIVDDGAASRIKLMRQSAFVDFQELGKRYLEQTSWRAQGQAYCINKLPINFQVLDLIHHALPHAVIVHMVREPVDVCFSNFKAMFGEVSAYSYEFGALAHYYGQYRRIMQHWHQRLPGVVLDVAYDELVRDPETVMPRVLEHCGLDMEVACLHPERNTAPVATPSSMQVRQPIHTRYVAQWKHYEAHLEPLREALGESVP
jgi:tetratricopeptide (TPR) repeat protein